MYSRRARPGRSFLLAASAVAAAISSAPIGSGCMISACHRQLPRSLPAIVTSPRATAATMFLLGRVVHPPQPFQRHDPRRLAGELLQPEVRAVAHAVQRLHRLGELGAAGLTGPGHRHEPELGDIHDAHRTLAHLEQRLVAGRDSGHAIMVAAARPTRKEPKVRNRRALGIPDGRRAEARAGRRAGWRPRSAAVHSDKRATPYEVSEYRKTRKYRERPVTAQGRCHHRGPGHLQHHQQMGQRHQRQLRPRPPR